MSVFAPLQGVFKFISEEFDITIINYQTLAVGDDPTETNRATSTIMANIQQISRRKITLNRNQSDIFDRVTILTLNDFVIGDPQDTDNITSEGVTIISYQQRLYRLMEKAHVQGTFYRYESNILRGTTFGVTPTS